VQCAPAEVRRAGSREAIIAAVAAAHARGGLRVVGAGHSFTPLVATGGVLLSLDGYQGIEAIDFRAMQVMVRGGTRLSRLGAELFAHGLAQENLGDIDTQSIAGAVSTGTHGAGAQFGTLATQVVGVRLITAAGEVVECSADRQPELFRAARLSLGALGVVEALTLRVIPAQRLHYTWRRESLTALLERLDDERTVNRHFEFFWLPYTDAALVKRINPTDAPARPRTPADAVNDLLIENGGLWLLSEVARLRPDLCRRICRLAGNLVGSGERIDYGRRIFATPRHVRFQEMEYSVPAGALADVVRELAAMIERRNIAVNFPIECRFVHGDDIPLSPAYGRDSAYIAVHMYRGMPYDDYFAAAEAIFRSYGGRPHWGKIHSCTASELQALYPEWQAFQHARRALDPDGLFLNPYLRALLGVE
jgi:FAD-linked oxidoreductase